ncbi:MAG: hypothetical protein IJQ06_01800 [Paludibacteraceae bacterium]|nr:hypothetical protein [Paludibacteraceae bacterium]
MRAEKKKEHGAKDPRTGRRKAIRHGMPENKNGCGRKRRKSTGLKTREQDEEKTSGMACRRIKTDAGGALLHAGE